MYIHITIYMYICALICNITMLNRSNIYGLNDKQILLELGKSLKRKRVNSFMTQKELAEKIGVNPYTVTGMEKGRNVSLETFIRILRETGSLELLYTLFLQPEPIAPSVLFKLEKKKKIRVRKSKTETK